MAVTVDAFRLSPFDLVPVGSGLRRPECVLTTACGDLYVSDERGGVARISPDGSLTLFAGRTADGPELSANGFAMLPDGSFLVAPLCGGGVFRLHRNGQAEPFLMHVDGRDLLCPNFVLLDDLGRVWICCLTQADRTTLRGYPRDHRDGYLVLVDDGEARVVAEGIGYPNEIRIDPSGRYLYTNETTAGRLLRFPLQGDGALGPVEVVAELDDSNVLDGFTLDSTGGAWLTAIISNRLWRVTADGSVQLVVEESDPEQMARLVALQRSTGLQKAVIYEEHGARLRNISSIAFGGPDLRTAFLGSLMGEHLLAFTAPVAGMRPAHWDFGSFG